MTSRMKKLRAFLERGREGAQGETKRAQGREGREAVRARYTKSTNRTEKELIRKVTNKICQGTDKNQTRKRASLGLQLSPKLRKVRQEEVLPRRGDNSRDRLKLTHPSSRRQRNQEEHLPRKMPKRARGQRLKGRAPEKGENTREIPRRGDRVHSESIPSCFHGEELFVP